MAREFEYQRYTIAVEELFDGRLLIHISQGDDPVFNFGLMSGEDTHQAVEFAKFYIDSLSEETCEVSHGTA